MMPLIRKRRGVWLCGKCGWTIDNQKFPHRATCPVCAAGEAARSKWRPFLVGDFIERCLSAIGITKARYARWIGKPPGGCGCQGRQRWANRVGIRAQVLARKFGESFVRFALGD